jgi:hypothetical protein
MDSISLEDHLTEQRLLKIETWPSSSRGFYYGRENMGWVVRSIPFRVARQCKFHDPNTSGVIQGSRIEME